MPRLDLRSFLVACALAATACNDSDGPDGSDATTDPGNASSYDPFAQCDLHHYLGMWTGDAARDCGSLGTNAPPADWTALHDCVLEQVAAGAPFHVTWLAADRTEGLAARGDPEETPSHWTFNGIGWFGHACTTVTANPDCTPGPGGPCLTCADEDTAAGSHSYCVYL